MWPRRFFTPSYWASRYWTKGHGILPDSCGFTNAYSEGFATCPDGLPIPGPEDEPPPTHTPLPPGRAFRPILRWDGERKETYIEDPHIRRPKKGRYR